MKITITNASRTYSVNLPDDSKGYDVVAEVARLLSLIYHPDTVIEGLEEAKEELCSLQKSREEV